MTKITTSIGVSALLSSAFAFAPPSPLQAFHGSDVAEHRHFCLQYSSAYHGTIGGRRHIVLCNAKNPKKRKKQDDSHDSWYDDVDENASPEDVFWEEMERRRLLNIANEGLNAGVDDSSSPIDMVGKLDDPLASIGRGSSTTSSSTSVETMMTSSSSSVLSMKNPGTASGDERSTEATLASYAEYAVSDNFLYDDDDEELWKKAKLGDLKNDLSMWEGEDPTLEEENAELNRQLDELERELFGDGIDGSVVGGSSPFFDSSMSDEPWDRFGQAQADDDNSFSKEMERKIAMVKQSAREFTLDYDDEHPEEAAAEAAAEEAEYMETLSTIGITSARLENAAVNPRAEAFFKRPPDERQGFDQMWVSAIDSPCMGNLVGTFSNYGIQFADNFDDWEDGTEEDGKRSIEDIASFKARKVYQVTGLPCISSRTSFEVEPIRPEDLAAAERERGNISGSGAKKLKTDRSSVPSPRVASGYRFNVIGEHVDHVIQALLPFSEPTRVTRFRSCVCFYDGEMEIFEYGELDCDIYFANVMRTFIPMATAINSMMKSLELALDLQFQKWLYAKVNDATSGGTLSSASIKLRDRVLKEAKVLPNDIIDVSSFMDACVDVGLMDECGRDLAERFFDTKPTKILTIATTGLVIALPMAKYLQVPLVYARKQRSVVMADTFDAGYNSKTIGRDRQLLVSKDHLDEDDRVLIVDDFLSSGSSQEALLRIISEAGATAVGVGVLLEKEYDKGRVSLSGFGIPVESVVRIASVRDGVIQLLEEDGYDKM
mmetsp:Transcript_29951/g.59902  ORF Transcript_29951/g.59902 Transcript_29951/m.59902 type:complete len:773 (-) Transcript_29951:79-2397(-)